MTSEISNAQDDLKGQWMTIPDSQMGLEAGLFACRMEKEFEAEQRCSFCGRASLLTYING